MTFASALRRAAPLWALLALLLAAHPALAQTVTDASQAAVKGAKAPVPWRSSQLTLRTVGRLYNFDRSAELTYNPYVANTLALQPFWWWTPSVFTTASFSLTWEYTAADDTTYRDEVQYSDLNLAVGAFRVVTIPGAGIDVSPDLQVRIPISKFSRMRTNVLGLAPGLRLSRRWSLLSGIGVGYSARGVYTFSRQTVGSNDGPRVQGCVGSLYGGCDTLSDTGVRNVEWRLIQSFDAWFSPHPNVVISTAVTLVHDWLYDLPAADPRTSWSVQDAVDTRELIAFDFDITYIPTPSISLGLGLNTFHPQLALDGSREAFGFNRYTQVHFDVRLDIASFLDLVTPGE